MSLLDRLDDLQTRFEAREPTLRAFLPEDRRFDRLRQEARALLERYPHADRRPPLFGLLVGVKDLFHVDGFATRAGSRLPATAFQGTEADSVARLKRAGGLIVGKTVSTEFAYFEPGPTRNPHNPAHTPGGSSSGSAAAVGAGLCELALGTQTIGSIVRPAAYCGVFGLKPTSDRVSTAGVIPLAQSLDHVGCLAPDVRTAARAARVLYRDWREPVAQPRRPVLGVPDGPYLDRASADTREWFATVCQVLADADYELRRVPVMSDFQDIADRQALIMAAEAALVHAAWFDEYAHLYGPTMTGLIMRGRTITGERLSTALLARDAFRDSLRQAMIDAGIDAWIAPSTTGPAPEGLDSTGDPVMNLPWTQAGLPAVSLPAGKHPNGLPLGLQVVADWYGDESLLAWAEQMEKVTARC